MKNLTQRFLTEDDLKRIEAAVKGAEKRSAGEIVCLVQSASYHYPMANVIGAAVLALPVALVLTSLAGGWFWIGPHNMWLFIGLFKVFFAIGYRRIDRSAVLKRLFISRKEIAEEVEEAAITAFFRQGLYRTRDATGVLLYISVLERKVWLLADHGIHAKVAPGQWDAIVARLTGRIRQKQAADAICEAVEAIGGILETHFPRRADDRDELDNVIVEGGRQNRP